MKTTYCSKCGQSTLLEETKIKKGAARLQCPHCRILTVFTENNPSELKKKPLDPSHGSASKLKRQVKWYNSLLVRFAGSLIILTTLIVGGFISYEYESTRKENPANARKQ